MSTSYYWLYENPEPIKLITGRTIELRVDTMNPLVHIGKQVGGENGLEFTWAQEPIAVIMLCEKHADEVIVQDEYGDTFTGMEFVKKINSYVEWKTHLIGEEFG